MLENPYGNMRDCKHDIRAVSEEAATSAGVGKRRSSSHDRATYGLRLRRSRSQAQVVGVLPSVFPCGFSSKKESAKLRTVITPMVFLIALLARCFGKLSVLARGPGGGGGCC